MPRKKSNASRPSHRRLSTYELTRWLTPTQKINILRILKNRPNAYKHKVESEVK